VPKIQSLAPENQHDLARIICGLGELNPGRTVPDAVYGKLYSVVYRFSSSFFAFVLLFLYSHPVTDILRSKVGSNTFGFSVTKKPVWNQEISVLRKCRGSEATQSGRLCEASETSSFRICL
jgi:hypothetical protein